MSTETILMTDIDGLGAEGDVVKVADGFARNYLFPRKLGAPVTEATRRQLAKIREERVVAAKAALEEATALSLRLTDVSVTIPVKVGEEDKMYGSVTNADIVSALAKQGIKLDKQKLVLDEPIRELGVFDVSVQLQSDIEAKIKVWVVEE